MGCDRRRALCAAGEGRGQPVVEPPAPLVAVHEGGEPGHQADQEIVTRRRQALAPSDQLVDVPRRLLAIESATGIPKRRGHRSAFPIDYARMGGAALRKAKLRVAQVCLDPRRRQRRAAFGWAPHACTAQPKLGAACRYATLATVDGFADIEQIPQIIRRAACEAQRRRSVAGAVCTQRQQHVLACQIAGLREDTVDAAPEIRSRHKIADRFDRKGYAPCVGVRVRRDLASAQKNLGAGWLR